MGAERSVLFDIDGTLVDSTAVVERAWTEVAAVFDADAAGILAVCHGKRDVDVVAEFFAPPVRGQVLRAIAEREAGAVDGVVAVPGAAEVLAAAGSWAAVTSGGRELMSARLRAADLPLPEVLITAEDVRDGKPAPEGYLSAARGLSADPARCVVVEDAPAGVAAGRAAGATVAAVTTTHRAEALQAAHVVLPELRSLLEML